MILLTEMLTPSPNQISPKQLDVQACYFDIDNTLIANDSADLPSEEFRQLAKKVGKILPINVATARSLQRASYILESINSQGISILSNGAVIYDGQKQEIVADLRIGLTTTSAICDDLRMAGLAHQIQDDGFDYRWEGGLKYNCPTDPLFPSGTRQEPQPYHPYKPRLIDVKVFSDSERRSIRELINIKYASNTLNVSVGHIGKSKDGRKFTELFIMHNQANKRSALLAAFAMRGFDKMNIVAVGDGPNDKELLNVCGIRVAMGNAVSETLKAASFIVPSQKEDGAVQVLKALR